MRFLLDTNALLWLYRDPARLKKSVRNRLADPSNDVYVSAASVWEIAIKASIGKLTLPAEPRTYVLDRMRAMGLAALPITALHALGAADLPPHHRDPFDRLLIAQAHAEKLTLVTSDPHFAQYDVDTLFV